MRRTIIMVGHPHSYTSVSAKHFVDMGYKVVNMRPSKIDYLSYEPGFEFLNDNGDVIGFDVQEVADSINSTKSDHIYKMPFMVFQLDQLLPLIKVPYRLIYVLRNPMDLISSCIERGGKSAEYYLYRYSIFYETMIKYKPEIIMGEWFLDDRKERKKTWKIERKVLKVWNFFSAFMRKVK